MRVVVAGATGAVGRPLVTMLRAAGHAVIGIARSAEKAGVLRSLGAEALQADPLDRSGLIAAVTQVKPDALIHQLTAIPAKLDPRRMEEQFEMTNRLRTEGTDNLLEAARAAGVGRFIAQSFGGYMPASKPGPPVSEAEPREQVRASPIVAAVEYVEKKVPEAGGIALRYGGFYGPGTGLGQGGVTLDQVRARQFPIVGKGSGVWSFVHIGDAASAAVAALERGAPGVYNVADDEPAPVSQWLPYLAQVIGAPPPRHVPEWLARFFVGPAGVAIMTRSRGLDNRKAKRELGWSPAWSSWREGFQKAL